NIEQTQRSPADHIPATWGISRIDSRLRATDRDRTPGHLLARLRPARRREFRGQPAQERKASNESYTANPIRGLRMATDHFGRGQAANTRDIFKVESELAVIANWNLNHACFDCFFSLGRSEEHTS